MPGRRLEQTRDLTQQRLFIAHQRLPGVLIPALGGQRLASEKGE
jgi:hypothetical protein